MKLLFVNFNLGSTAGINNGIAILSSVLKNAGHKSGLIFLCDELGYGLDHERIKKDIVDFKPDVLAISLMETQAKYVGMFLDRVRRYFKGFVICGGPYPTMSPEEVLSMDGVDAVCVGEGEDALLEVVNALEKKKDFRRIRNIWSRTASGAIIKNRLRPFKELGKLPAEDKELFDLERLLPLKNYQLEMMLGRGCAFRCSYCINRPYVKRYKDLCEKDAPEKSYIRLKNPDTVIEEMERTISRHPKIKKIAFIDDNFLAYSDFAKDFTETYKNRIGLPFICNANPASLSRKKAALLKEAGCDDIRFGVESGSARVRKDILHRPMSDDVIINAFRINKTLDIMTSSFNMIGLPTETREEVLQTLKLNSIIMPDSVKVMTFYPFKNTPLYDLCDSLRLIDPVKKEALDNYDTFTCLTFAKQHQLFLKKVQKAFNWYMNIFLANESSQHYVALVNDIENMTEADWEKFNFDLADKDISGKMKDRGIVHYTKYLNRSLAVKYPSRHFK